MAATGRDCSGTVKPVLPPAWRAAAAALSLLWLATVAGAGMVFLAQTLLARRFGPADYGLFASSLATVTMLAPLAGFGLSQFRLQAYGSEGWAADRWLRPSLRFTALTAALALAALAAWAGWGTPVDARTRAVLLALMPVVLGLLAIDLVGSKLRLEERYAGLAGWQLLMPGGRLLVAALAWWVPVASVQSVALGHCLWALAIVLLALPQLREMLRGGTRLHGHGPRPQTAGPADSPRMSRLWAQAWPYGLAAILYPVFFQISTVLLKYLSGDAHAGRYGVALAVMTAIYLFPATVYQKFLLSKLHRWAVHDRPRFQRVYRQGNVAMLVCGLLVGAALVVLAPCVAWLFGPQYHTVSTLLMVLALCVPIRFLSTAVGAALLTSAHMRYRVGAMALAALAAVVLNVVLIPGFQEMGAAAATVAAEVLLLLSLYRGVRRSQVRESAQ